MTDHAPLTDEELADADEWAIPFVARLIGDLRASRAELRASRAGADEAIANLTAELEIANAEIERLRGERDQALDEAEAATRDLLNSRVRGDH